MDAEKRFGVAFESRADRLLLARAPRESGARNFACYTSSMQSTTRPLLRSATSTDSSLVGPAPATGDSIGAEITALRAAEITGLGGHEYRPGLATSELVAEIRGLLATERRAECLLCRYLGDLADRVHARQDAELGRYADEFEAARQCFGLRARDMRERVRVGRALRTLRRIERAFIDGELSYSRVREVTRVATVQTEPEWLELARRLDMRSLERRVVAEHEARGPKSGRHDEQRVGERARTQWMGADRVRVTFELSREAWTLLERAMREARRAGAAGPSDGDALEAVARAALSVARTDTCDASDGIVASEWPTSGDTGGYAGEAKLGAKLGLSVAQIRAHGEIPRSRRASEVRTEATQGGSADEGGAGPDSTVSNLGMEATQGGSSGESTDLRNDDEWVGIGVEQAREPALRLMQVMGRSGGWTLDALTESSGLSAQEVSVALTFLELGGHVRRRAFAFDPV